MMQVKKTYTLKNNFKPIFIYEKSREISQMAEETTQVEEQNAQPTSPEGDVDYEALYHKEKKYSQSLRSRAQDAESKNDKLSIKAEEDRQAKLIAEGKKDDLIAELRESNKSMEGRLSAFEKQVEAQRESLLELIPEDERVHYQNMNLEQLQHFTKKAQAPEVSNPTEAIQGRTNTNYDLDTFMQNDDKYKRSNFSDLIKAYDRKSVKKTRIR